MGGRGCGRSRATPAARTALACARLGLETVIFTVSVDSIAMMPCNPNIGGSSKGHLVREVDALGGRDGKGDLTKPLSSPRC